MGQHAEDILNGDVDQFTGEWLGGGQGFPRHIGHFKEKSTGAKIRGVQKWLDKNGISGKQQNDVVIRYREEELTHLSKRYAKNYRNIYIHISGFCFNEFTNWFKKNYE